MLQGAWDSAVIPWEHQNPPKSFITAMKMMTFANLGADAKLQTTTHRNTECFFKVSCIAACNCNLKKRITKGNRNIQKWSTFDAQFKSTLHVSNIQKCTMSQMDCMF
jgi:hypothetical protein